MAKLPSRCVLVQHTFVSTVFHFVHSLAPTKFHWMYWQNSKWTNKNIKNYFEKNNYWGYNPTPPFPPPPPPPCHWLGTKHVMQSNNIYIFSHSDVKLPECSINISIKSIQIWNHFNPKPYCIHIYAGMRQEIFF